jgi:hypothetical protein
VATHSARMAALLGATMHLTWDPALPGVEQPDRAAASTVWGPDSKTYTSAPGTCSGSIPVPLASVAWGFRGDAINTLTGQETTGTNWLPPGCGGPNPNGTISSGGAYQVGSYPTRKIFVSSLL